MAENAASGFRNTRLVLIAVVLAIIFIVLLNLQRFLETQHRQANQVNVVLVKTDLTAGTVLNGTNVEAVAIDREVAQRASGLYLFKDVVMGVTKVHRPVAMNDLLRVGDMYQRMAAEHALAKLMKDNRQAISFPVDSREPSAFVVPGSRVDLWGPVYIPGQTARTQLIIENLEVLSVDGQTDPEQVRRNFRSVEVHVPSELVSKLKEVQRRLGGPMSLSIRAPGNMIMKYPYDRTHPEQGGAIAKPVSDSLARPFAGERARQFDEAESPFDQ